MLHAPRVEPHPGILRLENESKDPKFVGGATETCFNLSPILGFV